MNHQLNLIKIHKKNVGILEKQKAGLGLHCPMHVQSQLEHEKSKIVILEREVKRRLQLLLEQSATHGINTDPAITIEIEDIQEYFDE